MPSIAQPYKVHEDERILNNVDTSEQRTIQADFRPNHVRSLTSFTIALLLVFL